MSYLQVKITEHETNLNVEIIFFQKVSSQIS